MDDAAVGPDTPWRRIVDKIIRGERPNRDYLQLALTPKCLSNMGCSEGMIVMTPGKLARCRREHPEVSLQEFYRLPDFITDPIAIFPSRKDDGSLVLLLVLEGRAGNPIIAALVPAETGPNILLSVYVKNAGLAWIWQQITAAQKGQEQIWMREDFAATQPQPEASSEEETTSPSGPIPAGGAAKPRREILTIRGKVKES